MNPHLPLEITLMIFMHALTVPVSFPPSSENHQLLASILRTSREIRGLLIKDIYNTLVLWSASEIHKFSEALISSPRLGLLVQNLWVGNDDIELKGDEPLDETNQIHDGETVDCLETILKTMPNLSCLCIAVNISGYHYKTSRIIPNNVQHLIVPAMWFSMSQLEVRTGWLPKVLSSTQSIRIRGSLTSGDIIVLGTCSAKPLHVIMEMPSWDSYSAIITFLNRALNEYIAVPKHSIEIVTLPRCSEGLRHELADLATKYELESGMDRMKLVEQCLDSMEQLKIWLTGSQHSRFHAF